MSDENTTTPSNDSINDGTIDSKDGFPAGDLIPSEGKPPEEQNKDIKPTSWGDYYLKNIKITTKTGNYFARNTARGPAQFKQIYSTKLSSEMSSEISAETSLNLAGVASKLGVKVVSERTFTEEYSITIPKGKTYTIYAHPEFNYYVFDLWKEGLFSDTKLGTFWYEQPTGVYIFWQKTPK